MVTLLLELYSSNLIENVCLGHGGQVFYCNRGLFVRCNFYINIFSFKQHMAEFSTIAEA